MLLLIQLIWRRQWHPTPVFLPGKSHGRRSLGGFSPWGRGESDTTERLHYHFSLSCIEEGNGSPLQCSCLRNPRTAEPGGLISVKGKIWTHTVFIIDSGLLMTMLHYFYQTWYYFSVLRLISNVTFYMTLILSS